MRQSHLSFLPLDRWTLNHPPKWPIRRSRQVWKIDSKKAPHHRRGWGATGRSPKIEGLIWCLIEQRAKRLALLCHRFETTRCAAAICSDAGLRSVSISIALSFHPGWPPQTSFINILHTNTFDEECPETTLPPGSGSGQDGMACQQSWPQSHWTRRLICDKCWLKNGMLILLCLVLIFCPFSSPSYENFL